MNCQDLNQIEGLQFVPVDDGKKPIPLGWQTTVKKYDLKNVIGVGLVCGAPSNNLEAIDFDLKYDLTGNLYERYKQAISKADKSLLSKMVVQKTRSGGYHFLYRCNSVFGNTQLAKRHTTEDERTQTYKKTYAAEIVKDGVDENTAIKRAEKAAIGDKKRTLIETRGLGGQVVVSPSKGYEFIFGDLISISEITPEEREILITIARSFNEYYEEVIIPKNQQPKAKTKGLSPFDDYNERGDVVQLLQNHGWKVVSQKGNKTHLLRPGQTTSQTSGNYDHDLKWFSVFTTSSEFDPEHGYRPYAVFAVLECNKDFSEAAKKLIQMGYGERNETATKEKAPSTRVIPSRVNPDDENLNFLASADDYNPYLQQVIDGTLPMGLSTGSQILDEYFLLKEGNMVMTVGLDNSGKTVWIWWLLLIAAMYHGWEGNIYSSENSVGGFMRKMIQFFWGKPLRGYNAQTPQEIAIAKKFIEKHFRIIKTDETLYNYKDILNINKKLRMLYPNSKYGLIDPYNSLKTDLSGYSKLSTHDYHYEALSELKAYGSATKYGWFINNHPVTEALRRMDSDGYPVAPNKADTEGGGKAAFKADEFLTIHRKAQHPQDWNVAEIHVRKVKDYDTGGKQTPLNEPVKFKMIKNQCAYEEVRTDGRPSIDPIQRWHQTRTAKCEEEKHWADRKPDMTFEEFKEQEYARQHNSKIDGYIPDDEEKKALEDLLKKDKPF